MVNVYLFKSGMALSKTAIKDEIGECAIPHFYWLKMAIGKKHKVC